MALFFLWLMVISCQPKHMGREASLLFTKPVHFPLVDYPADNLPSKARIDLGRQLFYDPILSRDSTISCASCHHQDKAFTDGRTLSQGIAGKSGVRNVPTLTNVAYHPYFFAEGGSPTLELQTIGPIETEHEMGFNAAELDARVKGHPHYEALAQQAYGREMGIYVITRALAVFERTFISGASAYDQFIQGDTAALGADARAGMALFFSDKTGCGTCHSGHNFTDYRIVNIGLYETYADEGLYRVSGKEQDKGKMKTPTLRNVALTAPYMHDGSLPDLQTVLQHFNTGGKGHVNQDSLIHPLGLTSGEMAQLEAFLHSLTDKAFLQNPFFRPSASK
ncbi:MAG: cytochrome c peroxidase [Bacteroidota bacterium]